MAEQNCSTPHETVQEPKSLLLISKTCILKASTKDIDLWLDLSKLLPTLLAREIIYMLKIVKTSYKSFQNLNESDMFFILLRQGLRTFSENANPHLLETVFTTFSFFTKFDQVVRGVKNILEIDNKFLKYLIPRLSNLIILNNILILASYYGNFEIAQLCLKEGADDILTAQKAANLNSQHHMDQFLYLESQSNRFIHTKAYRIYHRVIDNYNDCCTDAQRDNEMLIKGYFTKYNPISYVPYQVGDLQIPMACWGGLNIFQLMCSLHVNRTKHLGLMAKTIALKRESDNDNDCSILH